MYTSGLLNYCPGVQRDPIYTRPRYKNPAVGGNFTLHTNMRLVFFTILAGLVLFVASAHAAAAEQCCYWGSGRNPCARVAKPIVMNPTPVASILPDEVCCCYAKDSDCDSCGLGECLASLREFEPNKSEFSWLTVEELGAPVERIGFYEMRYLSEGTTDSIRSNTYGNLCLISQAQAFNLAVED
ncbi:hypothetical protein DFH06DRAFT_1142786 [Mycena polygramma]|nr:hypothetical protein DFH06DRAFT_1142786 [Mycena polygramma]